MLRVRRVLAPVAALWLFCQTGTVMLVPVALWITAAHPHADECTCGHGDGARCPMHHKPASPPTDCAMQSAGGFGTFVLASLVGVAGLLPKAPAALAPANATATIAVDDPRVIGERPVPPDPPPPRA
jgi:hypothetical protein